MAQRKQGKTAKPEARRSEGVKREGRDTLARLRTHVDDLETRLGRADTLTRSSVKALETSFKALNERVALNVDGAEDGRNLTQYIQQLSDHLNGLIDQTRKDVAHDLGLVMDDPRLETLSQALTNANRRLSETERQQASAIGQINSQIADLALAVDKRLQREVRSREKGEEILAKKIDSVEHETSQAVKTIGAKMVEISQELSTQNLEKDREFEDYKSKISRQVEALEDDQRNLIPSLERQLSGLTTRMETLEDAQSLSPQNLADDDPLSAPAIEPLPNTQNFALDLQGPELESAIIPQQEDAFSPPEIVNALKVAPPPNIVTTVDAISMEALPATGTDGGAAQAFVLQEYVPQDYAPQENAAPEQSSAPPPFVAQIVSETPPAPPLPLANAQLNMINDISERAGTMEAARPGGNLVGKKYKIGGKIWGRGGGGAKTPLSMPVKMTIIMIGCTFLGLLTFKVLTALIFGSGQPANQSTENKFLAKSELSSDQNNPAPRQIARPTPERQQQNENQTAAPHVQTLATIGNYTDAIKAPDLGPDEDGQPSAQKLTLQAAADNGDPIAQYQLGLSHLEAGRDKQGVRLIRLAANQGQPAAQYRLGKLYEVGVGVNPDGQTAMSLLERSAKGGNRLAMHDLGHYLASGAAGIKPDVVRAVTWFQQAAEHGVLDSQFNLGILYQGGSGVEKNLVDAYVWFAVAGLQGDKIATGRGELVAKDLTAAELAQAQARVLAFAPRPVNEIANGVFKNLPWISSEPDPRSFVKTAQNLLNDLGYEIGTADGAMGPKTRNAIVRFERANGLPETGRASAELVKQLSTARGA